MKKISLITLISFFFLIPNVDAGYKTIRTTDYHYYFFSEPYHDSSELNDFKENGTINYAKFASYRNWENASDGITSVSLTNSCIVSGRWDSSNCWDLKTFYRMWDELYHGTGTIVCKGNTCSQDLKETINQCTNRACTEYDGTRFYHAHGAYKSEGETIWKKDINSTMKQNGNVPKDIKIDNINNPDNQYIRDVNASSEASLLACATIPESNIDKSARKYLEGTENVIRIERKLYSTSTITEEGKVDWDSSSSEHLSTCSIDPINAYNGVGGGNLSDKGVYSPALYRIKTVTEKYKCSGYTTPDPGKCNGTANAQSICEKQTIEVADGDKNNPETNIARAVASIKQDITLTNLLTPTKIYQGGGVKIGFLYKAEVTLKVDNSSIKFDGSSLTTRKKEDLKNKIKSELEHIIRNPEDKISADEFKFTYMKNGTTYKEDLKAANLQIKCNQASEGDVFVSNGKVVTTTCTILLPESKVNLGSGEVNYINGSEGNGINNEFYTPIKYSGDLNLYATFSGLSAINTSDTVLSGWYGGSNITIKYNGASSNCTVTTYPRFYNDDNKTYKFIYRPIDINNPFPNRNAGVNWYDWYNIPANKTRLKESYSNLEYIMNIKKEISSGIKNYNEIKNYNNNHKYFDWDGITENGRSEFVQTYGGDTP